MQTIIITTDFSESAANAAQYAVALSSALGVSTIVLYHSYEWAHQATDVPVSQDTVIAYEESLRALELLKSRIEPFIPEQASVEIVTNDLPLIPGIELLVEQKKAGLVVVGMTGQGNLEKFLVGSHTVALAETCPAPLLIVPKNVEFTPIAKAVFACDLEKVDKTTPVAFIEELVGKLHLHLLVLNIESTGSKLLADIVPEQYKLHEKLDHLHPEYHYTEQKNIVEGIMDFAETHQAGLVMTVPKSYGFFDSLFHRSVTKKLAHHTRLPLLLLRNE